MDNKPSGLKTLLLWVCMIAMFLFIYQMFKGNSDGPREMSFSEFKAAVEADKIKSVFVESDGIDVAGEFRDGGNYKTNKEKAFNLTDFITTIHKGKNIFFMVKPPSSGWSSILISLLPMVLLVAFLVFFMRGLVNKGKDTIDFGKAKTYESQNDNITFDDVAGIDEVKEELEEVVEFLKKPKKFSAVGAKIPKGVLLSGAPGVGKTLLARAVAGEASVPFLSINGSEFVQMFVGVGASRVRDLFEQAKKRAPLHCFY
ncbi:MAG: ATP-dependent metallopeptidase FtsH/Yme1/Tma family protein [bacterium]